MKKILISLTIFTIFLLSSACKNNIEKEPSNNNKEKINNVVNFTDENKLITNMDIKLIDFEKPKAGKPYYRSSKIKSDLPFNFFNPVTEEESTTVFVYWSTYDGNNLNHLGFSTDDNKWFSGDNTYAITLFLKPKEGYSFYNNSIATEAELGRNYYFNGKPCKYVYKIDNLGVYAFEFVFN